MRLFVLLLLGLLGTAAAQNTSIPKTGDVPPLNLQVAVGTQQRAEKNSFFVKKMTIQGKFVLEGASRLLPIPELEGTMLIATMDTRAKYAQHREVFKVHSTETVPVPPVPNGERRTFTFGESSVTFDGWRDSSNVGGEIYKYYVFALKDKKTGNILDFRTNNVAMMSFLKSHPERREELLKLHQGQEFPSDLK